MQRHFLSKTNYEHHSAHRSYFLLPLVARERTVKDVAMTVGMVEMFALMNSAADLDYSYVVVAAAAAVAAAAILRPV